MAAAPRLQASGAFYNVQKVDLAHFVCVRKAD
jgi:hypothetical protein